MSTNCTLARVADVTLSIMITFVLQDIQNETLSYITMHYELLIESFLILESTESMLL